MVAAQLIVRRTFFEVEGCDLKDRVFEMRRTRCMSDNMLDLDLSFEEPAPIEKEFDVRSNSTTAVCWSDVSDDDDESDCGVSVLSTFPKMVPAMPPGVFLPNDESAKPKAKRVGLWSAPAEQESRTTVLFRNVLSTSKRSDLCMLLNNQGFRGQYDFLYVPANFKTMQSFGYAFVNFVSGQAAEAARQFFDGFEWNVQSESSVLETSWSNPHQGYEIHVERYRDCPVMHSSVADEYKPIVLRGGVRVPFPVPTKRLIAPRDVRRRHGA
jgi:RNA recognition motif-containing protein